MAATEIVDSVREFLAAESHSLLIDGEWVPAADGRTFDTPDPSTGERLATVSHAGAEDVDRAVAAARRAFADGSDWRRMSAVGPWASAVARWPSLIEAHAEELAQLESLDNGKPVTFARLGRCRQVRGRTLTTSPAGRRRSRALSCRCPRAMYSATLAREPVGVCGQIIPLELPAADGGDGRWRPALAAGCTTVLKPAEQTPLSALRLGELALEAGIPAGVLNVRDGRRRDRRGARRPSRR